MSKINTRTAIGGGMQSSMKKTRGDDTSHKKNKKPLKSNITDMAHSTHNKNRSTIDVESDEDSEDGSTNEVTATTDDDADVLALPDAPPLKKEGAAKRPAGLHIDDEEDDVDDMSVSETPQASAGAGQEDVSDDEDDYADVEDVSDSDEEEDVDDEPSILRNAEQDLIQEFQKSEQRRNASVMTTGLDDMNLRSEGEANELSFLSEPFNESTDFSFAVNMNEDPFYGFDREGDEYQEMWGVAESTMWRMPETVLGRDAIPTNGTQKRVRFEETRPGSPSPSTSEDEEEDPNEVFPDLFTAADDPTLNQAMLSQDLYADMLFAQEQADNESVYDFEDEHERLAFQIDEESDSSDDSDSYSSSDDSDDATDVETAEEQLARVEKRAAVVKASTSTPTTPKIVTKTPAKSTRASSTPRPVTPKSGKPPRSGTFERDPTRPSLHHDTAQGKLKIQPPSCPSDKDKAFWQRAKSVSASRGGSPRGSFDVLRETSVDNTPARPFTAKSTLGSMFDGNLEFMRNNDSHGIAEDLYPHLLARPQTSFSSLTGTTEDSDHENRMDLDMQDFVHLNESDSDDEAVQLAPVNSPEGTELLEPFTPGANLQRRNSNLLDHFTQNRGVIGSFRRNQVFAKHLSSQPLNPAQRASAHEYNALQKGRRGAANTPITPARKKRASQDLTPSRGGVRKGMSSPLTSRRPRSRGNSLAQHADILQTLMKSPFGE